MEKIKNSNIELTDNERKTLVPLLKIEKGSIRSIKKTSMEICRETKIKNSHRKHKGEYTHRGYQLRILNGLIEKGVIEKDEDKKYSIKHRWLNFVSNLVIQKRIKDLENTKIFRFLDSIVFGIEGNRWLNYPEKQLFYESLKNALNGLFMLKIIKKIFLLKEFSIDWKSFLDSDLPLPIKYQVWLKVRDTFLISDNESNFAVLNAMGIPEDKIDVFKKEIDNQNADFTVKFRKKIGYAPKKYDPKKFDSLRRFMNAKQKELIDNILNWCTNIYPKRIRDIGFFLDISSSDFTPRQHFEIPIDDEENSFRDDQDYRDFNSIEDVYFGLKKETSGEPFKSFKSPIDDKLMDIIDIWNERNYSRLTDRFGLLYIKLVKEPFIQTFYRQFDEKSKAEIISILKSKKKYSKGESDYEIFHDYASVFL